MEILEIPITVTLSSMSVERGKKSNVIKLYGACDSRFTTSIDNLPMSDTQVKATKP